ncbi:hypothetical protein WMY93_000466 [Mugilogobius chulae]|uniref:C2H2-type domain-containing protein n=1 Tax=Mugilogobius chulae TaxID=88201 RepID=A0AAW0Q0E4_9GOBI
MFSCDDAFSQSSSSNQQIVQPSDRPSSCDFSQNTLPFLDDDNGEKPFRCDQCDKSFLVSSSLRRHERIHSDELLYQCFSCDKTFTQSQSLRRHLQVQHNVEKPKIRAVKRTPRPYKPRRIKLKPIEEKKEKPDLTCPHCAKVFKKGFYLEMHILSHTDKHVLRTIRQDNLSCKFCGKFFAFSFDLKGHIRTHTGEKPYRCGECGKTFALSSTLVRHKRTHTGERPYKCDQCGKAFIQSGSLSYHQQLHHSQKKLYKCQYCEKGFTQSSELIYHKCSHLKEGICQFCGNDLAASSSQERCHSCEECWKRFALSITLLRHKSFQTAIRFKCDKCKRTFLKPHHLKHHLLNFHKEDRPFVCLSCKKTFTQSSALEFHKCFPSKSRPHGCDECKKCFSRAYLLKMHKRRHAGAGLHKCRRCQMVFTADYSLALHKLKCFAKNTVLQRRKINPNSSTETYVSSKIRRGNHSKNKSSLRKNINDSSAPQPHHLVHSESYDCDTKEDILKEQKPIHVGSVYFPVANVQSTVLDKIKTEDDVDNQEPDDATKSVEVKVEPEISCEVCSETFDTEEQYYAHLQKHEIQLIVI